MFFVFLSVCVCVCRVLVDCSCLSWAAVILTPPLGLSLIAGRHIWKASGCAGGAKRRFKQKVEQVLHRAGATAAFSSRPSLRQTCHCLFSFTPFFMSREDISGGGCARVPLPRHTHSPPPPPPNQRGSIITCLLAPCTTTYCAASTSCRALRSSSSALIGRRRRAKQPWALIAVLAGALHSCVTDHSA